VRLFTRRGYDWTSRYPAITSTAVELSARSFTLDGEAVVCGPDGIAIFDALHRHGTVAEAMLYAFDLLEIDGEDLRPLPLSDRSGGSRNSSASGGSASCSPRTPTRTAVAMMTLVGNIDTTLQGTIAGSLGSPWTRFALVDLDEPSKVDILAWK
jgi:ATP-dependent DNA ligase